MMQFLCDNCVREIKVPTGDITCFDYNSDLNLIASFSTLPLGTGGKEHFEATIWNPDTGEIIKQIMIRDYKHHCYDILFLPGHCIGVVTGTRERKFGIDIYDIDSGEQVLDISHDSFSLLIPEFGTAALTYDNRLVTGNGLEFTIDFEKRKLLSKREIFCGPHEDACDMCCSKDTYSLYYTKQFEHDINCVEVLPDEHTESNTDPGSELNKAMTNKYAITYDYQIEDYQEDVYGYMFNNTTTLGIQHDGENLIFGVKDRIILLELKPEGNITHTIVCNWFEPSKYHTMRVHGRIRLTNNGQLMVCNSGDVIKVYEYKMPTTLLGLCRHYINKIWNYKTDKIEVLPISNPMKNYLLYKVEFPMKISPLED